MTGGASPRPGDVLVLGEDDYRYGVGPLVARVVSVVDRVGYGDEPWWQVEVDAANGSPGNHGGWVRRLVYVREASLPAARRPGGAESE